MFVLTCSDAPTPEPPRGAGAEKNPTLRNLWTPLHLAAAYGHVESVSLLVKEDGVDKNARENRGRTPLHWAAHNGCAEPLEVLLKDRGVQKEAEDKDGMTPLHLASLNGHGKCVDLLIKYSAEINGKVAAQATKGFRAGPGGELLASTPLQCAALMGAVECVEVLLKAGADKDLQAPAVGSPLHVAAKRGHTDVVKALLKAGANLKNGIFSSDLVRETPSSFALGGVFSARVLCAGVCNALSARTPCRPLSSTSPDGRDPDPPLRGPRQRGVPGRAPDGPGGRVAERWPRLDARPLRGEQRQRRRARRAHRGRGGRPGQDDRRGVHPAAPCCQGREARVRPGAAGKGGLEGARHERARCCADSLCAAVARDRGANVGA